MPDPGSAPFTDQALTPDANVRLDLPFVSAYGDAGLGLLGDPSRRAIFELLARRACSVQELADELPISRPAVSQHLRVLREGGLVTSPACLSSRRWRDTAGRLIGSSSASSCTERSPPRSCSTIARRCGSPSASNGSPLLGNIFATLAR